MNLTNKKNKIMDTTLKKIMELGAMVDKAGSETERSLIINDAKELYNKHLAELKLLNIHAFIDWYNKERRQYEVPEHDDVQEFINSL